jgi:dihydrofolate synthase / folylpolyglutamate synthase
MPSRASGSATAWIESLSPWPAEFGLDRMRDLLSRLGDPQLAYPAIHVVGTNGKSTTTLMIERLLADAGLAVGAYISPHVTGWAERIRTHGEEAELEHVLDQIRPAAEDVGSTQFEVLTAAALNAFKEADVDVAVVEAGLGGRLDATNVLRTAVVVLTSVARDHTEVLGETREEIAAEKLAVVQPGTTVVLSEPEWRDLAYDNGADTAVVTGRSNLALAVAAAESFLGRQVDPHVAEDVRPAGRMEHRGDAPYELWDGAHNIAGIGWLLPRLPTREWTIVASILDDKDVDAMLEALSVVGQTLVATTSSNARAVAADELSARARPFFTNVAVDPDPNRALAHARELAGPAGAVLVTGSLYLLADLAKVRA